MPVPNDLTPEEEAEFGQHGVASAGPGKEPIVENDSDVQQQGQQQQAQGDRQQGQEPQQEPQRNERPRNPDGTFMSATEIEAARIREQQSGQ